MVKQKLLPLKAKKLLVKHKVIKGIDDVRSLTYDDDDVIEFWIDGFNEDNLAETFEHIVILYNMYLKDDPNWHYIHEGDFTLIRCSYRYANNLERYFAKHDLKHKPISWWQEGTHVTATYKPIYKEIFHWTSILAIQMAINEEENFYINQAVDRIAHVFLLQAIHLAELNGDLDKYRRSDLNIMYWEADHMSNITKYRTYHIGTIAGHNALRARLDKIREKNKKEGVI